MSSLFLILFKEKQLVSGHNTHLQYCSIHHNLRSNGIKQVIRNKFGENTIFLFVRKLCCRSADGQIYLTVYLNQKRSDFDIGAFFTDDIILQVPARFLRRS